MDEEKELFFRFLCLITEVVPEVLQCRLKRTYTNLNVQTLQLFLGNENVLHTIFHLFYQGYLCCWNTRCETKRAKGFVIGQWDSLYNANLSLRCNKKQNDTNDICICRVTPKNVVESDLDLSLLSLILINCSNLLPREKEAVKKFRQMKNDYISHNRKCSLSKSEFDKLWEEATIYIKDLNNTQIYLDEQENLRHRSLDEPLMEKYIKKCLECEQKESQINAIHDSIQKSTKDIAEVLQVVKTSLKHQRDNEDDEKSRKRIRQETIECSGRYKDKTDSCVFQLKETKPLDVYRECIPSNLIASNLKTSHSLQMDYTIFTMKGLWKQKGFQKLDKFICGKCSWLFTSLDEFVKHKEQCKIRQQENEMVKDEYKTYVVARITVKTIDKDLPSQIEKDWKEGKLNPQHRSIETSYVTTGSVVIWVKIDMFLMWNTKNLYEALDHLVDNIFKNYQVNLPHNFCVQVYDMSTGYIDHISDEFCCADCRLKCNTLDNFLSHKNTRCYKSTSDLQSKRSDVSETENFDESDSFVNLNNEKKTQSFTKKIIDDIDGKYRAHEKMGSANLSKGHFKAALSHYRYQFALAKKIKQSQFAVWALGNLGVVYAAIGDYPNSLRTHKHCAFLSRQCGNNINEAREMGKAGAIHFAMKDISSAIESFEKHLEIAKKLNNSTEEAKACNCLGKVYHYKKDYDRALMYHNQLLKIALQKNDKSLTCRAYENLGHTARSTQDYEMARSWYEKQLDNALDTNDKLTEGKAYSNLGIIYQELKDCKSAIKFHEMHLKIAKSLGDRASQGRALGNIGTAHIDLKQYEQAVIYHKQEVAISSEVNDRHSEGATHGNLAVAYQALGKFDEATLHCISHLNISKELKDTSSEAIAVCNLANYYRSRGNYVSAVKYYEDYLNLSQELHDSKGTGEACVNLGHVHYGLGNLLEAMRYYKQNLSIAQELKDQLGEASAYSNLGRIYKSLHNDKNALKYHKKSLSLMKIMKNTIGIIDSLGYIGNLTIKTGDNLNAIRIFKKQLKEAKKSRSMDLLSAAYGNLGTAHRTLGQFEMAIVCHTKELRIRQDMDDKEGECRALGNLGNVYISSGNYKNALICYEEQLEKSKNVQDSAVAAQACGNLGNTRMKMRSFKTAISVYRQQLTLLEQVCGPNYIFEKGRALGNLGDCYEGLGDFEESIRCQEQFLLTAQKEKNLLDQVKAYRSLSNAHRLIGNLKQALVCSEKRLVVAHEINDSSEKASAYGELGSLHNLLGKFEQAISCLLHQLSMAKEIGDSMCEGEAACGLGGVYQNMGEYEKALEYHQIDLQIALKTGNTAFQCRAYGNLGLSHEFLRNYDEAIHFQEKHLCIAQQINGKRLHTVVLVGRVHQALNSHTKAVEYLKQGLLITEQLGHHEDEAKISYYLGQSLFVNGDLEESQLQLHRATDLCEGVLRDLQMKSKCIKSLVDLQTLCFQELQRVLVSLGRLNEALIVAERACTRTFVDYNIERHAEVRSLYMNTKESSIITPQHITSIVENQNAMILLYSIAGEYLYSWLVTPRNGIVKFHEVNMTKLEADFATSDTLSMHSGSRGRSSLLEHYIVRVRESLGVGNNSIIRRKNSPQINQYEKIPFKKTPLNVLYHILIEPMEKALQVASEDYATGTIDLVLVLQREFYFIPFSILKKDQKSECLFERFNITITSSFTNLKNVPKQEGEEQPVIDSFGAVVVGNPKLSPELAQHGIFKLIPKAEYEARVVGELLTSRPLIGPDATKAAVLRQIEQVEVIHFCTHILWKHSSIVLAWHEHIRLEPHFTPIDTDEISKDITGLSEYLLTADDIRNLKLHAKLVVLSTGYTDDRLGRNNSERVMELTRALLSAGAKCVLYSLWPLPDDDASTLLMKSLYTNLLEGQYITRALQHAMKSVRSTKKYSHPANWAGWVLVGHDVKLNSKKVSIGHAICKILLSPGKYRETFMVLQHLIEKSSLRITHGIKNSMFVNYTSLENKVRGTKGWKDLLNAVGFLFEAGRNHLHPRVFFPESDPGDRLKQSRSSLQALLSLPPGTLSALSKFLYNLDAGEANIKAMRHLLNKMSTIKTNVDIQLNVKLWKVRGCHEFFVSLGLELVAVDRDAVTLSIGKQTVRRQLKNALKLLVTVFDTNEASESTMDNSSSLESLSSSHIHSTSTSNFSKGRTPANKAKMKKVKEIIEYHDMNQCRYNNTQFDGSTIPEVCSLDFEQVFTIDEYIKDYRNDFNRVDSSYHSNMSVPSFEVKRTSFEERKVNQHVHSHSSHATADFLRDDFEKQLNMSGTRKNNDTELNASQIFSNHELNIESTGLSNDSGIFSDFEDSLSYNPTSSNSKEVKLLESGDNSRQSITPAASNKICQSYSRPTANPFHRDDTKQISNMSGTKRNNEYYDKSNNLKTFLQSELGIDSRSLSNDSGIHSDFDDPLLSNITTFSNSKGVELFKSEDSTAAFSSTKSPHQKNFTYENSLQDKSDSRSSVYTRVSPVKTGISRSRQETPNVAENSPSRKQLSIKARQRLALSGFHQYSRTYAGLALGAWHNKDSDHPKNEAFTKRPLSSSSSCSSSFSGVIQSTKTKSILNDSLVNPTPSFKKIKKRVSFSDSEPSDLDSSYHSRSTYDSSPVTQSYNEYVRTFSTNGNIYQGVHNCTTTQFANTAGPNKIQFLMETML